MRDKYLGDSYDIVKRFWAESLRPLAALYAHPRFVPAAIRRPYTSVTSIPILELDKLPGKPFGLLLDPHTGIPLPAESSAAATATHAPLLFIARLNTTLRPAYIICFDQSYHRRPEFGKAEQQRKKQAFLQGEGIDSFFYDSHAPFLFMAGSAEFLSAVRERLVSVGVPEGRIKSYT
jgi:hypothetical protein